MASQEIFKPSGKEIFEEKFDSYPEGGSIGSPNFGDLKAGDAAKISFAKTPIKESMSLLFWQKPGNVDGTDANAEVFYDLEKVGFQDGRQYGGQITFEGELTNRLEIYFDDKKITEIIPGQYSNQRTIFFSLGNSPKIGSPKMRFVLVGGPTGNGTSLFIDDLKIVDETAGRSITIGGVTVKTASEIYSQCSSFSANQIIVVVPDDVQNGKIEIRSRFNEIETTDDDNGPKIKDFLKNGISRPGLCRLSPSAAQTNEVISLFGNNFGNGSVFFGDYQKNLNGQGKFASDTKASAAVPVLAVGNNSIFVSNGKPKSNFLFFEKLNDLPAAPNISAISPDRGPVGQYVTISGSNFGDNRGNGKVFFGSKEAVYTFPSECAADLWSDKQILVKAPDGINPQKSDVMIKTDSWEMHSSSNNLSFYFDSNEKLKPGICKIDPSRGPANSTTTLFGENFGSSGSAVKVYFNSIAAASTISISNKTNKAEVLVPAAAVSGLVRLEDSNPVNFQVGACGKNSDCSSGKFCCPVTTSLKGQCVSDLADCVGDVKNSVFEWAFSTKLGTIDITNPTTPPPSTFDSCLGVSKEVGSCQTSSTCPNVPGKCSSGSTVVAAPKGPCCPSGYSVVNGSCIKNPEKICSDTEKIGSFCKVLPEYENRQRLVYSSNTTCINGWIKINGGLCAKGASTVDLKTSNNCSLCENTEKCLEGKCKIDLQCKGGETCNSSGECVIDEAPSCECCCQISNGNQDCCAPLTCGGTCGSDTNPTDNSGFGKCSGCFAAGADTDSRDAACNCSGHNGQFCATSGAFPTGACVDCATLDTDECMAHSSVCCLDAKATGGPVCRGGVGNLIPSDPGYCAYYNCSDPNNAITENNKCASSTPGRNGTYSSITACEANCKPSGGNTGLGLSCGTAGKTTNNYTCDTSICSGVFGATSNLSCLTSTGGTITSAAPSAGGECGVCCCNPKTDTACKAINSKLSCLSNKGDCSGASRGLCCGCSNDGECNPGGVGLSGCGVDSCCYPKPTISGVSPAADSTGVCRNAALQINFDRIMIGTSLNSNNVKLLEEHVAGFKCPTSTPLAADNLKENIFVKAYQGVEKIIISFFNIFKKDKALADNTANHTYCQVPINVEAVDRVKNFATTTVALIKPKAVLKSGQKYLIFVRGNNQENSPADGVLSGDGVGMSVVDDSGFSTADFQVLHSDLKEYENQIKNYQKKVSDAEINKNFNEILATNDLLDEAEKRRNNTGLMIAKAVNGANWKDLGTQIEELEELKKKIREIRSKMLKSSLELDVQDFSMELGDLNIRREEIGEVIDQNIKKYASQPQDSGFYQGAIKAKINNNLYKAFVSTFTTRADICEIDYTTLVPNQYLFSTAANDSADDTPGNASFDSRRDRDKVFEANAYSIDDQLLNPVTGYNWTWVFKSENPSLISTTTVSLMANKIIATAADKINDGKTLLYSTVEMSTGNQYFGGNGEKSSSELFVFICANPWPRIKSDGTWAPWRDKNNFANNPFNYDFYYCRDAGKPGTSDDLPEISESAIPKSPSKVCSNNNAQSCSSDANCSGGLCIWDILKEYYFFSNK